MDMSQDESKTCCHIEKTPQKTKDGCCDSEEKHFQVDFDHFSEYLDSDFGQFENNLLSIIQKNEIEIDFCVERLGLVRPNPPPLLK